MPYIGNTPAPQNVTSTEITDGTITNADINASAAIDISKLNGVTATATELNYNDINTLGTNQASKVVTTDAAGNTKFPDNYKAYFGDSADLQIFHDGNSKIQDVGTGNLEITTNGIIKLQKGNSEYMAQFNVDGAVQLYYDNAAKLATTSYGTLFTGNSKWADNGKATFGAGDDLQIYHDGSDSWISDAAGAGNLYIRSNDFTILNAPNNETLFRATQDGSVILYYDNVAKLSTTALGADVTGEFIADSYNETYAALSGTTPTVNCETGNVFSLATTGNTTFTFSNPPASGTAYGFVLKLTAGGTHTITYPASVDWAGGTAPDAPASGETDVLVFYTHDGGTTWYGALSIDAAA